MSGDLARHQEEEHELRVKSAITKEFLAYLRTMLLDIAVFSVVLLGFAGFHGLLTLFERTSFSDSYISLQILERIQDWGVLIVFAVFAVDLVAKLVITLFSSVRK